MRVELRGVGKRFDRVVALRDVTATIPAGARVALIGPNGSGKTTLTRIIMGLLGYEGEARVDGKEPVRDRAAIARRLAYVPQIAPQTSAPVGELVRAVCGARAIDVAKVGRIAARMDLELPAVARRPFRGLSGGTRQKVLLALALASDASLLILDEPTASLDVRARQSFFALFEELAGAATLLLCSHRLEEIRRLVDRVLVLEDGRATYEGPADRLLAAGGGAVLECRVDESADPAWLAAHGFTSAARGWWVKTVGPAEKLKLVPAAMAALNGKLRDLNVREAEHVDLEELGGGR
jgi:ABC-2 type transport system ATP-binding protein